MNARLVTLVLFAGGVVAWVCGKRNQGNTAPAGGTHADVTPAVATTDSRSSSSGAALGAVFIAFVPLAFSADFVEVAFVAADTSQPGWVLGAVDAVLIAILLLCGWRVRRTTSPVVAGERTLHPGVLGAALTLGLDFLPHAVWDRIPYPGTTVLYVLALGLFAAFTLRVQPRRLIRELIRKEPEYLAWERFRPVVPLLVGTAAAYHS